MRPQARASQWFWSTLGSQALKEGKTVVHYTLLSLQDTVIATRYDSCITGYPLSDIINFKQEVYEEIKDIDGSLIVIKEYPYQICLAQIQSEHIFLGLLSGGITPGMVIVDYADLLKPVQARKGEA